MYRDRPTRAERAQAIAGVAAIHLALGALALSSSRPVSRADEASPIQVIDLAIPDPPPPPPPPPHERDAAEREAGAPAKKAEPAPVVAPVPRIELPAKPVIAAAPVAGTGSAPSAGAAAAGSGTGAGGAGTGAGGGGRGDGGGAIGEEAHLLYGGLSRRDYRRLRAFALPAGRAVLDLRVGPDGRVSQCTIRQSSGAPALDAALCALLQPRMQWRPARDRAGRPITVGILYTAVWDRD
jgi:protein TonB